MKTYTIYEAKTYFSELVKRAAAGETVLIGSHGKPTVQLKAASGEQRKQASLIGAWKGFLPETWEQISAELDEQIAKDFYTHVDRD